MNELEKMCQGLMEYLQSGKCDHTFCRLAGSNKVGTEVGEGLQGNGNFAFIFLVSHNGVLRLPPKIKEEVLVFLASPEGYENE